MRGAREPTRPPASPAAAAPRWPERAHRFQVIEGSHPGQSGDGAAGGETDRQGARLLSGYISASRVEMPARPAPAPGFGAALHGPPPHIAAFQFVAAIQARRHGKGNEPRRRRYFPARSRIAAMADCAARARLMGGIKPKPRLRCARFSSRLAAILRSAGRSVASPAAPMLRMA